MRRFAISGRTRKICARSHHGAPVTEAPGFFVPGATPDDREFVFAGLAKFAAQPVPVIGERVYSITYDHDGKEWMAAVGETLRGLRHRRARSKTRTLERSPVL